MYLRGARGLPWGAHWKSPAFAAILRCVASGRRPAGVLVPESAFAAAVAAALALLPRAQAEAYRVLSIESISTPLWQAFEVRLSSHFPAFAHAIQQTDWDGVFALLRTEPTRVRNAVWKTWLGGWHTSKRMHEAVEIF